MNLADVVRINALNRPDKAAICHGDEIISYRDAWRSIEGIAAALDAQGAGPGDRVALSMKDHALHLLAHYAVARLGAVILPVDHRWTATERNEALRVLGARLVLADGDADGEVETRIVDEDMASTSPGQLPAMDEDVDRVVLVSLSSGTTGKPKGALVTHRNLYERFVSQWTTIGYDSRDTFAIVTPLFFGAGRSFGMSMLAAGGTVRLVPPPMPPEELVDALCRTDITAAFLPPTLLRRLLPLAPAGSAPLLEHIRYLIVSGEPLYAGEAAAVRERLCPNLVGYYASSEGGGVSVLPSADFAEHADTVGTPTFRTEVRIVGDDGTEVPPGEVGRLCYRGPGVATRFVDSDGVEHGAEPGGWFFPGDLAERLPGGRLALRGRDSDVIIRGGINIYPPEIEAALQQHPAVRECAVVARDDAERGQLVVACIAGDASADALEAHCRKRLAPYKIPGCFVLLDELPKAPSGKIDKTALARLQQS